MQEILKKILLLGFGGFLGSNSRYWISRLMIHLTGWGYPLGTLVVNAAGSFILGFIAGIPLSSKGLSLELRLLIGTGFLGALTTFSTFSVETVEMFQKGSPATALLNTGLNIGLGFLFAFIGLYLTKRYV